MINTTNVVVLRLVLKYIIHIQTLTDDTTLKYHITEDSSIISCISDVSLNKIERNSIFRVLTNVFTHIYKYHGF